MLILVFSLLSYYLDATVWVFSTSKCAHLLMEEFRKKTCKVGWYTEIQCLISVALKNILTGHRVPSSGTFELLLGLPQPVPSAHISWILWDLCKKRSCGKERLRLLNKEKRSSFNSSCQYFMYCRPIPYDR